MKTKIELTEQNYKYLFENASDAMWVHDMKGNIVDANRACKELTGYSREELIGMNIKRFLLSEESMVRPGKFDRSYLRRKILDNTMSSS